MGGGTMIALQINKNNNKNFIPVATKKDINFYLLPFWCSVKI